MYFHSKPFSQTLHFPPLDSEREFMVPMEHSVLRVQHSTFAGTGQDGEEGYNIG